MTKLLTIGQLAKQVGLRTSALRYYEEQGLLTPAERSDSGYRLYDPKAEITLSFIQRAQRLGFSLADIRVLLKNWQDGLLEQETILQITQQRYFELERQMTQSLVLQHELGLFLQDLRENQENKTQIGEPLDTFLKRVCNNPLSQPNADTLDWLLSHSGCTLNSPEGRRLLEPLRGQHMHVWQQEDQYHILVVSQDEAVGKTLEQIAALEAECQVHAHHHSAPQFANDDEGFLLVVQGENAFIYVRLFLMLEAG
ncbi:MAG: hypothetical protein CL609_00725 [Anaerolineaceae bacterium]|nr:hypothetical protein [Anaerolineaceae bacterium]